MNMNQIEIGKEYRIIYPDKKNLVGKVLYIGLDGDCEIQYKNGHKALWHWSWLEEIGNSLKG